MGSTGSELTGARRVLRDCLGLANGQSLVIILDETTAETAAVLSEAADLERIPYSAFLVPVAVQRRIPAQSDLSLTLQAAAHDARAILTCVNSRPDCLRFRDRILETQWSARTRLGHMPGADLDVLKLAKRRHGETGGRLPSASRKPWPTAAPSSCSAGPLMGRYID